MTLLSQLRSPRAGLETPAVPITSSSLLDFLGISSGKSGVKVTEKTALGVPAAWRAVSLIASTAATLPLHPYEVRGDARVRVADGPAAALLDMPHPDLTPVELLELVFVALLLWGNAYLLCLRDRVGEIKELWWVAPSRVRVVREKDGRKAYVIDGEFDRPARDVHLGGAMLHIPGMGYDGVEGASPIRVAREAFGMALAAEEYGARLFGSGSLSTGILTTEQRLDEAHAKEIKALWKASGGVGLESAHDIRVIGSGAKFEQLSIPPADAQFIESRKFQLTEIARIFGIPPHMLGETEKATSWGTGIEQQNIGFVTYTLRPWLSRVEQRLSRILPGAVYARFSVEGLLRGDSEQRAKFYRGLWEVGAFSTNDILALEERPPVEGGDARYVPLNFGLLGSEPAVQAPDPAPAPAARARAARAVIEGQEALAIEGVDA